ncbi:nucleotide-binding universal stress UspA family protein [Paenibacillus sp. JGP012]|uniref:universal stress protein n=1 Tax=Paenibacillus sp. JGP012 TaxID=2735914 RepID=UPI0016129B45|nr:universal stress protein [Paenibacillus sp. JGP012]MBB6023573.1 nucleotide-binding universal stress UspA family protein [Paenibacillus sp. JGP012]
MYQHILLAADGSKNAIRAAKEAAYIASLIPDAEVEILFVVDLSKVKEEVLHSQNHEEIEMKRKQKLMPVQQELTEKHVKYRVTFVNGDPGPTIVDYANKNSVDLLIIGSRGLNSLQEFVLGSVSHKVVKRAHCPVMIVK